mmetsp:Transcript_16111/g.19682  ORF Transcript_16111/g.19682 Transcript_16111/m.19682 type:complete len:195 (+) Transcript_16111:91-675(+)
MDVSEEEILKGYELFHLSLLPDKQQKPRVKRKQKDTSTSNDSGRKKPKQAVTSKAKKKPQDKQTKTKKNSPKPTSTQLKNSVDPFQPRYANAPALHTTGDQFDRDNTVNLQQQQQHQQALMFQHQNFHLAQPQTPQFHAQTSFPQGTPQFTAMPPNMTHVQYHPMHHVAHPVQPYQHTSTQPPGSAPHPYPRTG